MQAADSTPTLREIWQSQATFLIQIQQVCTRNSYRVMLRRENVYLGTLPASDSGRCPVSIAVVASLAMQAEGAELLPCWPMVTVPPPPRCR